MRFSKSQHTGSGSNQKRIVAFVDFEHWYYSMQNLHGKKPNISEWFALLSAHGRIIDCVFFADFSQYGIRDELAKIRAISNKIIETRNPNPRHQKDYTDFIMLDHIYQRAMQDNSIDMFAIFSGDGHFSSVVSFMKNYCKKEVGIYGVSGATSRVLKDAADWFFELPDSGSERHKLCETILAAIKRTQQSTDLGYVSYASTVSNVAATKKFRPEEIEEALQFLITAELIRQDEHRFSLTNRIKTLTPNWEKLEEAGYRPTPEV